MGFVQQTDLVKAFEYFDLKDKKFDVPKIINRFLKGNVNDEERIGFKNNLLIHLMESKRLSWDLTIPVKNHCTHCGGRGFDVILFAIEKEKCHLRISKDSQGKTIYSGCNGTGWKIGECRTCSGTGIFQENLCPTCWDKVTSKSRGTYLYKKTNFFEGKKCLICNGTGEVNKLVQRMTDIQDARICKKCNGSGILTEIGTSVISSAIADKLKNMISENAAMGKVA